MYKYSSSRHIRRIRYNDKKKTWEWVLCGANSGRVLSVLLSHKDQQSLKCQIEGWKKSE